jgi:hypothetical protein
VDLRLAVFTLVVDDCGSGTEQLPAATDVFGFFHQPGAEHDEDSLQTGYLEVPRASPIAEMAWRAHADPYALSQVEASLRANVAACPCTAAGECPAVDELRLLEAIEHATGNYPPLAHPSSVE